MPNTAPALARADRPRLAPAAICDQPVVLFDSAAADRGAAVLSTPRPSEPPAEPNADASTAASSRCLPSGRWRRCWRCPPSPAAARWPCGVIRSGSSLGLWIVLTGRRALQGIPLTRALATWAIVFTCLAARLRRQLRGVAAFRPPLPRGVLPGRRSRPEISQRYRAVTGHLLDYVIATMWDGGNIAHYAPEPSARADRRQAGARALDRSWRP